MIYKAIKYPLRIVLKRYNDWNTFRYVSSRAKSFEGSFEFNEFKSRVLLFINNLRTDESGVRFRYSDTNEQPTLYASAYACMTYSLLGELDSQGTTLKESWVAYFDSFQNSKDGLFYDQVVRNEHYDNSDWWGARHLALHMISAYTDLGAKPRYRFHFLEQFYDLEYLQKWLKENESMFEGDLNNDFDNRLMNIGCLLQYQRDSWQDDKAANAIRFIQEFLRNKINTETGIWGESPLGNSVQCSRKVQFAYHLFPLFFYDDLYSFDFNKIAEATLRTENRFGGYGVAINSSACDDIDSVDILIRIAKLAPKYEGAISDSIRRGLKWILLNQMSDGGFVFRLNEPFVYGHQQLSSTKNSGAVFPTWFRTLSLAYICRFLNIPSEFQIRRCPGYEF